MNYLILSDIHGNLEALQSVLLKAKSYSIDKYVVLGDLVGYGASPNEVVELVREMNPIAAVRGNHDKAAVGLSDAQDFNYAAREAALWTRMQLLTENREYVARLPRGPVNVDGFFDIVHGSPWDESYYIFQWRQAKAAIHWTERKLSLYGHTHVPAIWTLDDKQLTGEPILDEYYKCLMDADNRYLINPGSVGQPRDMNPKAAFAIFDSDKMEMQFYRIDYNIEAAQAKIRRAELDRFLADRLEVGR